MRSSWFLAVSILTACTDEPFEAGDLEDAPDSSWDGKADGITRRVVTASSVEALNGDLSSLSPACVTADPGHTCAEYLAPSSALGSVGPIGAYGPLGTLGPLGNNAWNSSYWISAAGDWSEWSDEVDGPLGANGPLGPDGPLSDVAYYETLPSINDWSRQLQGGGVFTVLGPLGPLGPLGGLGPLGPVGAHGFHQDSGGRFSHDGRIVRTLRVPYATEPFELVEMYDEATAQSVPPDTSYVALGSTFFGGMDSFPAKSQRDQVVTIALVPEYELDDFDLVVRDPGGREIARSDSSRYIDWVQLQAPIGGRMKIEVVHASSGHFLSKAYRLYVVGSGSRFYDTDLRGAHQKTIE